jgi:hypothetical protein
MSANSLEVGRKDSGVVRLVVGLCFGGVLTIYSFGFVGIGHGTAAPLAFTVPFIPFLPYWAAAPSLFLGPLLWALYFLVIPKIETESKRIIATLAILFAHILAGTWVAIGDPAFTRALSEKQKGLVLFALLLAISMASLFYFAVLGNKRAKPDSPS